MSNGAMLIISISSANTRANPSERGIGTWVFVAAPSCCRALHHQVQGSAGHQAPGSAGLTIFDHGFPMFSKSKQSKQSKLHHFVHVHICSCLSRLHGHQVFQPCWHVRRGENPVSMSLQLQVNELQRPEFQFSSFNFAVNEPGLISEPRYTTSTASTASTASTLLPDAF